MSRPGWNSLRRTDPKRRQALLPALDELTGSGAQGQVIDAAARIASRLQTRHKTWQLRRLRSIGVLEVGRYTYGIPTIYVSNPDDRVIVGDFCSIAPGVQFVPGGEHPLAAFSTFPFHERLGIEVSSASRRSRGPIVVSSDVWIGTGAVILSGVTIGTGAVIAAGAVVARSVEPYEVVGGVPARHIRNRFAPEVVRALLDSRWWELPISRIVDSLGDSGMPSPEIFLESLARHGGPPNPLI